MKVELEEGDWREVEDLRVVDLRLLLGKFELSKTGTKPILIKRLEAHLQEIQAGQLAEEAPAEPNDAVEKEEGEQKEEVANKEEPPTESKEPEEATPEPEKTLKEATPEPKKTPKEATPEPEKTPKEATPPLVAAEERVSKESVPEVEEEVPSAKVPSPSGEGDSPLMLEADLSEFKDEEEIQKAAAIPPKAVQEEKTSSKNTEENNGKAPNDDESNKSNKEEEDLSSTKQVSSDEQPRIEEKAVHSQQQPLKPTIPFRKLSKSVSKEDRGPRPWSGDCALGGNEESAEAVSTESLKDIIPDLKPLLETLSESPLLEDETAEVEMKEEKTIKRSLEEEKDGDDANKEDADKKVDGEEEEIPAASPTKRPRIDAPTSTETAEDEDRTEVLLIHNLVRPFTLKQLKELLGRTGTIEDFWINKIKSHCFVRFSKVEEASETRKALDDVKWPSSNPKRLSVTFSTSEKMKETAAENTSFESSAPSVPKKEESKKEEEGAAREQPHLKAADEEGNKKCKESKPQLLDDLFRKTKTTPCIYWTMNEKSLKRVVKEDENRKKMEVVS